MNIIYDGNYLLHRMIWAEGPSALKNSGDFPTGGVLGTVRAVRDSLLGLTGHKGFFVLDGGGYSERRKSIAPEYKEDREKNKTDPVQQAHYESFSLQRGVVKDLLGNLALRIIDVPGKEADDVIAWLTTVLEGMIVIVTDDMDLLQLVGPKVSVFRPMHKDRVTEENFEEIVGVPHRNFLLMKAAVGRESVKGVRGFGAKTAQEVFSDPLVEDLDTLIGYCYLKGGKRLTSVAESHTLIKRNLEVFDLHREQMFPEHETEIRRVLESEVGLYVHLREAVDMLSFLEFQSVLEDLPTWLAPFARLS